MGLPLVVHFRLQRQRRDWEKWGHSGNSDAVAGQPGRQRGAFRQMIRDLLIGPGGLTVGDNSPVVGPFLSRRHFLVNLLGLLRRRPGVGSAGCLIPLDRFHLRRGHDGCGCLVRQLVVNGNVIHRILVGCRDARLLGPRSLDHL